MKKKLFASLLIAACIFSLAACGKKEEEPTEEQHNYAVNPVTEKTEETNTDDIVIAGPNDEDYAPWNRQSSDFDEEPEVEDYSDISYIYPNDRDANFYVNGLAVAQIVPFNFILDDVSVSTNEATEITEASTSNHIYCSGYTMNLNLSDVKYDARYDEESLAMFVPAIDKFKIGTKDVSPTDLIRSTKNFEELIKFCDTNFDSRKEGNTDDIFSLAVESKENDIWGTTYIWKFSIGDAALEYTAEDIRKINSKNEAAAYEEEGEIEDPDAEVEEESEPVSSEPSDMNSEIVIEGVYNTDGKLSYYTLKLNKKSHFLTHEVMLTKTREVPTGEYETIAIDSEGNQIPLTEIDNYDEDEIQYMEVEKTETETYKEPSGYYMTQQSGHDFSHAYILLKDKSRIGMDGFSFTIHNSNLNSKLNIDYIAN